MVEKILIYERDAFFALNGSDSAFLDRFMWIFTGKAVWLPLAFLILLVLIYKKNWRESLLILLAIVLVVTLCDQFASHVCKPVFTLSLIHICSCPRRDIGASAVDQQLAELFDGRYRHRAGNGYLDQYDGAGLETEPSGSIQRCGVRFHQRPSER